MPDASCSSLAALTQHHTQRTGAGLPSTLMLVAASQLGPAYGTSSGSNFYMSFPFTVLLGMRGRKLGRPWAAWSEL